MHCTVEETDLETERTSNKVDVYRIHSKLQQSIVMFHLQLPVGIVRVRKLQQFLQRWKHAGAIALFFF